jgi:cation diffusion facilitator CzcD-associated flavoprotein CzcO
MRVTSSGLPKQVSSPTKATSSSANRGSAVDLLVQQLNFDPEMVRARHVEERDKRMRPDGSAQYIEVGGDFRHYVDDPHSDPNSTRAPLTDEVEVAIIGGGFSGLVAASRLREGNVRDIRIIDKAGDFGGTWYWNRYPGVQCDTEAYIYLPLLEETGYIPKEKYSRGPEILAHARRIGEKYDLYRQACFQTQVTELCWLEEETKWLISTNRNDRMKARIVLIGGGPLSRPKLPGIPGIQGFKGHTFHTSRWDYEYTGGDSTGNLQKLADKRVAIIGTGATAIQCVPHLGRHAQHLYVFQRTPSSVAERGNRPTDPGWAKSLRPGWQRERLNNFSSVIGGNLQLEDLVGDNWSAIPRITREFLGYLKAQHNLEVCADEMGRVMELADMEYMNKNHARIDATVMNKKTAQALKAWYRAFCKRPTFNDEFLPTFNRPNVTLVDTLGHGVERITEKGIVFAGKEYEVDCIIFSTGFEVGTAYTRRVELDARGVAGKLLSEHWGSGLRTLHGFYSHGFPNLIHLGHNQNGITANWTTLLYQQTDHMAEVVLRTLQQKKKRVEPTAEAEAEWVATVQRKRISSPSILGQCTPSYMNNEGKPGESLGLLDQSYGSGDFEAGAIEFHDIIRAWRAEGGMKGLQID